MKLNPTDFLRKSQFPLMIVLGILPALVFIVLQNAPFALPALAVLAPVFLFLTWGCMLLPGKVRLPSGIVSCALILLLSLRTLPITPQLSIPDADALILRQRVFLALIPLTLCGLLIHCLQFAGWTRQQEIAFNWYAAGVVIHLLILVISYAERRLGSSEWEQTAPILTAVFIAFLLLVLLSMNRTTMSGASLGRQQVPPSMRRQNVIITLSILGIALLIAAIPAITRFAERVFTLILRCIGAVIAWLAGLLEDDTLSMGAGPSGGGDMMPYVEYQEPSLLAVLLEKIAMVLALIAFMLILMFCARAVVRLILRLIRRIQAHLARYMTAAAQDYVDEITDTREESGARSGSLLDRFMRFLPTDESKLSPAGRIRHRYRLLIRRNPGWPQSRTARENLPDSSATLYERARYSGEALSGEEADQFARDLKNLQSGGSRLHS